MNWRLKLLVGLIKPEKNTIESELLSSISSRVVEMFGVRDGQKNPSKLVACQKPVTPND